MFAFFKKYYSLIGALALVSIVPLALSLFTFLGRPVFFNFPNAIVLSFLMPVAYVFAVKLLNLFNLKATSSLIVCVFKSIAMHLFLLPIFYLLVSFGEAQLFVYVLSIAVVYCLLLAHPFIINLFMDLVSSSRRQARQANREYATLFESENGSELKKIVWIFSFTGVANEPRVLRQASAMIRDGWHVVVLGYDGHSQRPEEWTYIRLPSVAPYTTLKQRYLLFLKLFGMFGLHYLPGMNETFAKLYHRGISNWRYIRTESLRLLKEHPELKPDLVVSHDYFTCDVGYSVAKESVAKFTVDCHEYSTGQYMDDRKWVKYQRPYVVAMQDFFLSRADLVTTVCDGIAELLNKEHTLKRPVVVVRSVPFFNLQNFKPTGEKITVLYHGDVSYARGLQKAIQSLPHWREEFNLLIRGSGEEKHLSFLKELAVELGVEDRLIIEGPVPFDQIVPKANEADIGYFVHRDISPQKRFTLPNKFFEYLMAGVALCVSDLPEMSKIVKKYQCGRLVQNYDEHEIADVINSFDTDSINESKKASLRAAEALNWNAESQIMLTAYQELTTN